MTLRVALLGCGRIASFFHAPILRDHPGVRVMSIADPEEGPRNRVGDMVPGAVRYNDWTRAIEDGEIDAVVITLPPELHAPAAIAAFEAGLSVYVEKPLALSLDDGEAIATAWRAAGTAGAVGLNFRHHPNYAAMRRRVEAGELGEVVSVRTIMTSPKRVLPGWKRDIARSGGVIADLGTHHLDLAAFITGSAVDPNSIAAHTLSSEDGGQATIQGRLQNGALLQVFVSQLSGHGENRVEILGTKGHLTAETADAQPRSLAAPPGRFARLTAALSKARKVPGEILRRPGQDPSFRLALSEFIDAATKGGPAGSNIEDGLAALRLVDAARKGHEAPWRTVSARADHSPVPQPAYAAE